MQITQSRPRARLIAVVALICSAGRFQPASSGYTPKAGDVILYNASSPFGQHTNIVVSYDGDSVTTVGGNENGKIRAHTFALTRDPGVVGFGVL
jgi:hypothetical protein